MEEQISPNLFFKGYCESLKPFNLDWHFRRKEIDEVVKIAIQSKDSKSNSSIISVIGNPGTGRSFTIYAAVDKLNREHRSLAIRINDYSTNKIPNENEMNEFLEEIENALDKVKLKKPEYIIIFSTKSVEILDINKFKSIAAKIKFPISLIFEETKANKEYYEFYSNNKISFVDTSNELSAADKELFSNYLVEITKKHRITEIQKDEAAKIIDQEKLFLPILYRTIDPARRSIDKIVTEEFNSLLRKDSKISDCISFCALSSFYNLSIPISVLKKGLSIIHKRFFDYSKIYEFVDEGNQFIMEIKDLHTNPYFSIYHQLIAKRISELAGKARMNEILTAISQ